VVARESAADLERGRKATERPVHEQLGIYKRTSPNYASIIGDKRLQRQVWTTFPEAIDDDLEQTRASSTASRR